MTEWDTEAVLSETPDWMCPAGAGGVPIPVGAHVVHCLVYSHARTAGRKKESCTPQKMSHATLFVR